MTTYRTHTIPFAIVGQTIQFRRGKGTQSGIVKKVAKGHGWPCYLIDKNVWVGHEEIL
jgi:hypothetical protein